VVRELENIQDFYFPPHRQAPSQFMWQKNLLGLNRCCLTPSLDNWGLLQTYTC